MDQFQPGFYCISKYNVLVRLSDYFSKDFLFKKGQHITVTIWLVRLLSFPIYLYIFGCSLTFDSDSKNIPTRYWFKRISAGYILVTVVQHNELMKSINKYIDIFNWIFHSKLYQLKNSTPSMDKYEHRIRCHLKSSKLEMKQSL